MFFLPNRYLIESYYYLNDILNEWNNHSLNHKNIILKLPILTCKILN